MYIIFEIECEINKKIIIKKILKNKRYDEYFFLWKSLLGERNKEYL